MAHSIVETRINPNTLDAFEKQAVNPAGRDPYLAAFNLAIAGKLKGNSPVTDILAAVEEKRPTMPSSQEVNLVFRAIQYLCLKEAGVPYPAPDLLKVEGWEAKIEQFTGDSVLREKLIDLLETKDTTTTIPGRYVGLRTVIHAFFGDKDVSVLDVGCSKPLGLDSAGRNDGITQVVDHTDGGFITKIGNKPIKMSTAVGTDITDPFSQEATEWREACGCYPGEIEKGELEKLRQREAKWQQEGIQFVQEDITKQGLSLADFNQQKPFECVQMATMLYQLPPDKQLRAVQNSFRLLQEGGILIIQDFVEPDDTQPLGLRFLNNWGKEQAYKTIVYIKSGDKMKPLDVIHWDSGRCKEAFPGRDFHVLQEANAAYK